MARAIEEAQVSLLPQLRALEMALQRGLPALRDISVNVEALAKSSHIKTVGDDHVIPFVEDLMESTQAAGDDLERVSDQVLKLFRSPQLSQPHRKKPQDYLLTEVMLYLRFGGSCECGTNAKTAFSYKEIAELIDDGGIKRTAIDRVRDRIRKSR